MYIKFDFPYMGYTGDVNFRFLKHKSSTIKYDLLSSMKETFLSTRLNLYDLYFMNDNDLMFSNLLFISPDCLHILANQGH